MEMPPNLRGLAVDAGGLGDEGRVVAALRHLVQSFVTDAGGARALLGVDERSLARDFHGFGHGSELEAQVDGHELAQSDDRVLDPARGETGQFRGHGVGAARKRRETIRAGSVGGGGKGAAAGAGGLDGGAGDGAAL